ncbi:MauE/DoxX family redox-associated membrane protein [Plantactinospora sp. B24E8]|uniref:MauE/DoxX family redox-associated membrane protein n=1 Tax=Plantactinospora sp. B24E8 TaxID=3153567 RepID=UPI00325DB80B
MSYVLWFSRCLLALVFLASAAGKLTGRHAFRAFADSLRTMDLLPARLVVPVAGAVVAAETAVPPLLLVPLLPVPPPGAATASAGSPVTGVGPALSTVGFALAAALLLGFTVTVATVLRRGTSASCRCFGEATTAPFGRHHLVRNVVLTVIAGTGGYAALVDPGATAGAAVVSVPLAVLGALVVVRLDDLVALFRPAVPSMGVTRRGTTPRGGGPGG